MQLIEVANDCCESENRIFDLRWLRAYYHHQLLGYYHYYDDEDNDDDDDDQHHNLQKFVSICRFVNIEGLSLVVLFSFFPN